MKRKLDWKPSFDARSKEYPIRGLVGKRVTRKDVLWVSGPILNQGREGACVGFGWTDQALSTPNVVNLKTMPKGVPTTPQPFAKYVYNTAKTVDEQPGEDYEGTSVLAGAKVMKSLASIAGYAWAFSIDDVIDALIQKGPVVLGINWYDGMYEAPNGMLTVSGELVGGHCILAIGYTVSSKKFGGQPTITLQNSWGPRWGSNGLAEILVSDLRKLLKDGGEACLPLKTPYDKKSSLFDRIKTLMKIGDK